MANWRKLKQFDAVLEVRNAYKSIIRLPRQDTNIEAEMPILAGYTGYGLWICTSFAPFEFTKERIVNNKESLKHGSNMANEDMDEIRTMLDNENLQYEVGRTERS